MNKNSDEFFESNIIKHNNEFFLIGKGDVLIPILFNFEDGYLDINDLNNWNIIKYKDCNHSFVFFLKVQERSGDEIETYYYQCKHCGFIKRD